MRCHYRIETANPIVYHTLVGKVAKPDILEYRRAMIADPCYRPGSGHVIDIRRLEPGGPSFADLEYLARFALDGIGRMAFVIATPYQHGLVRQFAGLVEVVHDVPDGRALIQIFHDPESARSWLSAPATVSTPSAPKRHLPIPIQS
jgi:hypothetical protein